jgi:hypothetical protein
MLAIERTTKQFVASVKEALPDASVGVSRSRTKHGRSNYVLISIEDCRRLWKVRISDHPVGMRRALSPFTEHLYIHHRAKPASWAVWVSHLPRRAATC